VRNESRRLVAPNPASGSEGDSAQRVLVQPWALRAIGRRGVLLRHAALQTRAMAAGATLDTRRLPASAQSAGALPRAVERHLGDLGRPSIVIEN
jgi:hypothetical protein